MVSSETPAPRAVTVSPELTVLVAAADRPATLPDHAVPVIADVAEGSLRLAASPADALPSAARVILLLDARVFARLESRLAAPAAFALPPALRVVARAMLDCALSGEAGDLYCAAKAIELLCELVRHEAAGTLAPLTADGALSQADTLRILRARQLIDERWGERLTLDRIASHCGVNRDKLTRGFRALFACSIAEAIAERRLDEAGRLLLATDLPVAAIGYRAGYQSNASFSRAFARHHGMSPTDYRVRQLAHQLAA